MLFREKNDDSIELVVSPEERKLLYDALRYYSAYFKNEEKILAEMGDICTIMNVLHLPGF